MIGGNMSATLQHAEVAPGRGGIAQTQWRDIATLHGWMDLVGGSTKWSSYSAALQESSHVFLAEYQPIPAHGGANRLMCDGKEYDVLLLDDPMGQHRQLEVYLKYVGAMQ